MPKFPSLLKNFSSTMVLLFMLSGCYNDLTPDEVSNYPGSLKVVVYSPYSLENRFTKIIIDSDDRNIVLLEQTLIAYTDENGLLELEELPLGDYYASISNNGLYLDTIFHIYPAQRTDLFINLKDFVKFRPAGGILY